MTYAESVYFDRAPYAHIVAWEEARRLARLREMMRRALQDR